MLLLSVFLLGSSSADAYIRECRMNGTGSCVGIGGSAGPEAGASTGRDSEQRREKALMDAGNGVLTGAAVGKYMDGQEVQFRQLFGSIGASVSREGDRIVLDIPCEAAFDLRSADIRYAFYDVLSSMALVLNEYGTTLININGYADSTGNDQFDLDLSLRRAVSIGRFLIARGVDPTRMAAQGMGKSQANAGNDLPNARRQSGCARIEVVPVFVPFQV